jgi:Undecaprenyl-phosphate glucose phosphotransferase
MLRQKISAPANAAAANDLRVPRTEPAREAVRFTSNVTGWVVILADILCFLASAPVALLAFWWLRRTPVEPSVHVFGFFLMLGSFLLIRSSRRAYDRTFVDASDDRSVLIFDTALSSLIASALVWQSGQIEHFSRGITLLFLATTIGALVASRPLVRRTVRALTRAGRIQQRVVFYGADPDSVAALKRLVEAVQLPHLQIIGVVDDRSRHQPLGDVPFIGGLSQVCALARSGAVDQVLIGGSRLGRERLLKIVEELSAVSVDVSVIPAEAIDLSAGYTVNLLGHLPVLTLWQRPLRDANLFVKRAEDLLIGSLALLFLLPLLAVTAVLIRATSRGPVLFVQPRVGFNNEIINVYKFRTMYADQSDFAGKATTTRNDPRITPLGRILRKLSIDELPQLFNVLEGTMSLVGPRPHAIEMKVGDRYYHDAVRGYAGRHRIKPGITGLAQVRGLRGEVRTIQRAKRRIELDQEYLDNWSVWLDLRILAATARAVFFDSDAY